MATAQLVVIVGPTASGKTALSIDLAEELGGEIICADSRTVYKNLDIGTAKPTAEERERVRHHLVDVVSPDESFTVADFKRLADVAIEDITSREKIPILVGGSGLYVDSVIFNYQFAGTNTPKDPQNPRHLMVGSSTKDVALRPQTLVIGLSAQRDVLQKRITERVDRMVEQGLVEEVKQLREYAPKSKALDSPGYKAFAEYLDGSVSLDEAKALFIRNDMSLAKRQLTWFKRNNSIHWVYNREEAVAMATTFLSKIAV